jgi:anthranilate synthase component 1
MQHLITNSHTLLADSLTPVSIYLKVRDRFQNPLLLESNDFHYLENCVSYVCLNPIAEFKVSENRLFIKQVDEQERNKPLQPGNLINEFQQFLEHVTVKDKSLLNGFFGYMSYDTIQFFENLNLKAKGEKGEIPSFRYQLFRYVIAFNHLKNQITITENLRNSEESQLEELISLLRGKPIPQYPFRVSLEESANMTDSHYKSLVDKAKEHCQRGDVFQLVFSRSFSRNFIGDEFNVYRTLRSVNPSPYLFYFDYGDYKLIGSSPEMQLKTENNKAILNPIAGTFKRTGEDTQDKKLAEELLNDVKEHSEHVMLVDLARNDLGKNTENVQVDKYKEVQFYSHVLHIVSSVTGEMRNINDLVTVLVDSFPAGTLTGAPKYIAMQLIDEYEPEKRGYYGGAIGFISPSGKSNHAIMIRTLLSKDNSLYYQAGAGIINESEPEGELEEVENKLAAIRSAVKKAVTIHTNISQL